MDSARMPGSLATLVSARAASLSVGPVLRPSVFLRGGVGEVEYVHVEVHGERTGWQEGPGPQSLSAPGRRPVRRSWSPATQAGPPAPAPVGWRGQA
jgi:hypothetical protein